MNQFLEVVIENTTIKILLKKNEIINILENIKIWSLFHLENKLPSFF